MAERDERKAPLGTEDKGLNSSRQTVPGPRFHFRLLPRASCVAAAVRARAVVADEVTPRVGDLRRHTVDEVERVHLDVRSACRAASRRVAAPQCRVATRERR